MNNLPGYVRLGHSELRLSDEKYYRDAGNWSVSYEWKDDKLLSISSKKWLNGVELIPSTFEEWKEDNAGYIGEQL